jgi:prepilin-type N-terminal cleavage/methylation domain-containing protein
MKNFSKNLQAFSLVEISIVILIIGILIAGISSGADLFNDYKLVTARKLTLESPVPRIADLGLWFESASEKSFINNNDSIAIKNGDLVKKWLDINLLNPSKPFLGQTTVNRMPTYVSDGINNLPSVKFDSTNQAMKMNGSFSEIFSLESTIFIVLNPNSVVASSDRPVSQIFSFGSLINPALIIESFYDQFNTNVTYLFKSPNPSETIYTSAKPNRTQIYKRVYNPLINQSYVDINGIQTLSTAVTSGNYVSPVSISLGNHPQGVYRTFGGLVGEFILYNRALSNVEIKRVENYLKTKWGVRY